MKYELRLFLVLIFTLVPVQLVRAQMVNVLPTEFEQGDISEIKDKRYAFVSSVFLHQRENILKELRKHKDEIQIVTNSAISDFIIAFAVEAKKAGISNFGPLQEKWNYHARLVVYIRRKGEKPRVVWETSKLYIDLLNKEIPITNMRLELSAVRDFVKALKKAREFK